MIDSIRNGVSNYVTDGFYPQGKLDKYVVTLVVLTVAFSVTAAVSSAGIFTALAITSGTLLLLKISFNHPKSYLNIFLVKHGLISKIPFEQQKKIIEGLRNHPGVLMMSREDPLWQDEKLNFTPNTIFLLVPHNPDTVTFKDLTLTHPDNTIPMLSLYSVDKFGELKQFRSYAIRLTDEGKFSTNATPKQDGASYNTIEEAIKFYQDQNLLPKGYTIAAPTTYTDPKDLLELESIKVPTVISERKEYKGKYTSRSHFRDEVKLKEEEKAIIYSHKDKCYWMISKETSINFSSEEGKVFWMEKETTINKIADQLDIDTF